MRARRAWLLLLAPLLLGCGTEGRPASQPMPRGAPAAYAHVSHLWIEPQAGVRPIVRAIDRAQQRVFICAYILSQHGIIAALERAASEGVAVYALLDEHPYGIGTQPEVVAERLRAAGVHVRWSSPRFTFTHAKYLVLDDRVAIVSTANFSRAAFSSNREILAEDRAPADVREVSNLFRRDWNRDLSHVDARNLVVAPFNARPSLRALLSTARHSVDVYAEEVTDASLEGTMTRLRRDGVVVKVIVPAGATSAGMRILERGGVSVRALTNPYAHAKAIVVDGSRAFVGSENVSETSLDHNRELGVLVGRRTARVIAAQFGRDWRRALPVH